MYDVIIIGAGPAGLTAGIYTGRARLKTLILEAGVVGGNAAMTDMIENYPGFPFGVSGPDLMDSFNKQAERFGVELVQAEVIAIENTLQGKKVVTTEGEYVGRTLIVTVGARRRELGVEGEKEFLGRGVSYCATCDGAFFKGVPVAVVGGGDTAVKEALYLSDIASKVYLIHRREGFRANPTSLDHLFARDNIELKLNRVVKNISGTSLMNKVVLNDLASGQEEEIEVEGIFVSIGMVPAGDVIGGLVKTRDGYVVTDDHMQTSIEGIFAAGDICVKQFRQVATAVGDGAVAGMAVTEYLKGL